VDKFWSSFRVLKEKRSIGGWVLWLLLLLWNVPSEGQNFEWWRQHVPMLTAHSALISWLLAVGGIVWMIVAILWPERSNQLWLDFDEKEPYNERPLRIQNSGGKNIFDVVVSIPGNGSVFTSDAIPRLANDRNWIPCLSVGIPETHKRLTDRLVELILSGEPHEIIPVFIRFRGGEEQLEIRMPIMHGIKFSKPPKL